MKLKDECNKLIEQIEEEVKLLLVLPIEEAQGRISVIATNLLNLFPEMLKIYQKLEINHRTYDITYWPKQLERIIQTNEKQDIFSLIDILYFETRESLLLFMEDVKQS